MYFRKSNKSKYIINGANKFYNTNPKYSDYFHVQKEEEN